MLAAPSSGLPPAGSDVFDSAVVVRVAVPSLSFPETPFTAVGPARIRRGAPYDPGDGRIKIDTQIEQWVVSGETPLGPAVVRVVNPAPGCIQQQSAGQDFPADAWFDVSLEIVIQSSFGPITVFSDPAAPIRLTATLDALTPFEAQYEPADAFAGVDLVDASGSVVGFLGRVTHFVGQRPTFSVAPDGPSSLDPADLFERATAPAIRAAQLGLNGGDVDGLSYGRDFVFPQGASFPSLMDIRFSVAAGATGRAGSAVERETAKSPPQAHGDEFRVTPFAGVGGGSNVQVLDEDGDTAPPFPLQISDDLDALVEQPPSFADNGDGAPDRTVFFSLAAGSPELSAIGANGATILQSSGGSAPTVFLAHSDLGLTPADDIDAFCLAEGSRDLVFSLAPGSPSLNGASPADVFMSLGAPGSFFPWATAANLGLLPGDDVDALKCHVGSVALTWNGRVSMDVLQNGVFSKRVDIPCHIETISGAYDGEVASDGLLSFIVSSLDCEGMDGEEEVRFRARLEPPGGTPTGQIFGTQGPGGRIMPLGSGSLALVPNIDGWGAVGLHGPNALLFILDVPLGFPGDLQGLRGATDDSLSVEDDEGAALQPVAQTAPYDLFLEGGIPTEFAIEDVVLEWDARTPPAFTAEGFLDAAGFGERPSLGGLASLFGSFDTETEIAGEIPLPRRLAGNVQVLFDSDVSLATLGEEGGGPAQAATVQIPAPLLFTAPTQLNLQIPWEARVVDGAVSATVVIDGSRSASVQLPVADTSPGLFTADFGGGRAIAINPDGTLAQPAGSIGESRPALPGETLVILTTGLGETSPGGVTGANSFDADGTFVRRDVNAPVRVLIGGVEAQVVFAGLSPEFVGVFQINATVPEGVTPGDAIPLVVEAGERQSRDDVTIAVGP